MNGSVCPVPTTGPDVKHTRHHGSRTRNGQLAGTVHRQRHPHQGPRQSASALKRLRLTVTASGARVSYPYGTHPARVSAFLRENAEWLERELGRQPGPQGPAAPWPWAATRHAAARRARCRCAGPRRPYPRVQRDGEAVVLAVPRLTPRFLPVARGLLAGFLEERMRRDVARWMARMVPPLGLAPTGLRIRPMQSQWGSLDTRDRINLDLSLALAPPLRCATCWPTSWPTSRSATTARASGARSANSIPTGTPSGPGCATRALCPEAGNRAPGRRHRRLGWGAARPLYRFALSLRFPTMKHWRER